MRLVILAAVLFAFWLLLSGHYEALLIGYGVLSVGLGVLFARRLDILDEESLPYGLFWRGVLYWPWLILEIMKSAIDVTKIILNPKLPISPTLMRVTAHQKGAVGITTYANSITLTPGTISAVVSERKHEILVHALTEDGGEALEEGEMDRRVATFEAGT
ncbi:Na+/H+ antiporter subunit E [Microbaculum marinisediminis]|uniref:Na+/H+ antiporter subunit E n=1 Tax=Microbaculum marinisediminis TaxID=2931392 RepID=A0AAW5QW64_9HYPH|nr:Na+/H+ antiporter subunit E [Microbaculum sp. A6E488]MCT8971260.1 Na+/H+ antiporter subunit E [Microbaculum sp. A6E488]